MSKFDCNTILFQMKSESRKIYLFEKRVCLLLNIDQCHFQIYANQYRGYALLLRNWITEAYQTGSTAKEVAETIKNSKFYTKSNLTFYS